MRTSQLAAGGTMRFAVDAWAPEYGTPLGTDVEALEASAAAVRTDAEIPAARWEPLCSAAEPAGVVRFVDGVRRIDARVWISGEDGRVHQGIAASFAAGVVRCDRSAEVESWALRRGVFSAAPSLTAVGTAVGEYRPYAVAAEGVDELSIGLQQRMAQLEALVTAGAEPVATGGVGTVPSAARHAPHGAHGADRADDHELLVVDGPLGKVPGLEQAVGYVKTHRRTYLPPELTTVVDALAPGQRTPLFLTTTGWSRWSWYLRLPDGSRRGQPAHAWSGVVRCEASGDLATGTAAALADRATATLPRYASSPHRDPRAPQNLVPVGQLERRLRHALGDPRLVERALRTAAAG